MRIADQAVGRRGLMGNGALCHSLPWEEVPLKWLDLEKKTTSKPRYQPCSETAKSPWPLRNLRKTHVTLSYTHKIITKTHFAVFHLMILLEK